MLRNERADLGDDLVLLAVLDLEAARSARALKATNCCGDVVTISTAA